VLAAEFRVIGEGIWATADVGTLAGSCVIVHGAGSFGHFQAKEFDVASGAHHERHAFGLATTRASVCKLNHTVVRILFVCSCPDSGPLSSLLCEHTAPCEC